MSRERRTIREPNHLQHQQHSSGKEAIWPRRGPLASWKLFYSFVEEMNGEEYIEAGSLKVHESGEACEERVMSVTEIRCGNIEDKVSRETLNGEAGSDADSGNDDGDDITKNASISLEVKDSEEKGPSKSQLKKLRKIQKWEETKGLKRSKKFT